MKKTLFLAALTSAALYSTALAATETVTVNGQTYNVAVVDSAQSTKPEGDVSAYLINYSFSGNTATYHANGSQNAWIGSLTSSDTLIAGATDAGTTPSHSAHKMFFDTGDVNNIIINANIIAGGSGGDDLRFWNDKTKTIVLKGDVTMVGSTLQIWNQNGTQHIEGALLNGSDKELKIVGTAGTNALLRLSGGGTIGTLNAAQNSGNVTLSATKQDGTAASGTSYTIGTVKGVATNLTIENGITANIGSVSGFNGNIINGGTLNIANAEMKKAIANTGAITFSGTNNLSGLTAVSSNVTYGDDSASATADGNGYQFGEAVYSIVTGTTDGVTLAAGTTFTAGSLSGADYNSTNGQVTLHSAGTAGGQYFVNNGALDYTAESAAASAATTEIVVTSAATITMGEGTTLDNAHVTKNAMTTVTGSGTYVVSSNSNNLNNAEALLGNNLKFTGNDMRVVITGGALFKGIDIGTGSSKFGGATLEINGIAGGYLYGWDGGTMDRNIVLTNTDTNAAAWTWSDGTNQRETIITFSGNWSGSGDFAKDTDDKGEGFKFTGDISQWTGNFSAKATTTTTASKGVTSLTFSGNAKDINLAAITNKGNGALNIAIATTDAATVASAIGKESTGAVNLTVNTEATFNGAVNVDTLTLSADATFNDALTVANSVTLNAGSAITVDNGSNQLTSSALTVNGDSTINANLVTTENSTISFEDGAVTLNGTLTLGSGTTVSLGTAYLETLKSDGQVLLFTGVTNLIDSSILESIVVTGDFLPGHLLSVAAGDGTYNIYATPEPATATLSLLALAGLMARRRRH